MRRATSTRLTTVTLTSPDLEAQIRCIQPAGPLRLHFAAAGLPQARQLGRERVTKESCHPPVVPTGGCTLYPMGGPLEKHEFHPRQDHPRICHVCGRHENSMIHLVVPKRIGR